MKQTMGLSDNVIIVQSRKYRSVKAPLYTTAALRANDLGARHTASLSWHALTIMTMAFALSGCSVKEMAIGQIGKALAESSGGAFAEESDLEFAGEALPFSLKLVESLLYAQPDNPDLLLTAASGFTQYSYVWVNQKADFIEDQDFAEAQRQRARARAFYMRAYKYAARGLEQGHAGFSATFQSDPTGTVVDMKRADVPLMYWAAASLGATISISKTDPEMIARLPEVEALADKAFELDPEWENGTLDELQMQLELVRPGGGAEAVNRARAFFQKAIELSAGRRASPYLTYAESICVPEQNRGEFVSMLNRALAIDPEKTPENRLANVAMQERARWLLSRVDELFLE